MQFVNPSCLHLTGVDKRAQAFAQNLTCQAAPEDHRNSRTQHMRLKLILPFAIAALVFFFHSTDTGSLKPSGTPEPNDTHQKWHKTQKYERLILF